LHEDLISVDRDDPNCGKMPSHSVLKSQKNSWMWDAHGLQNLIISFNCITFYKIHSVFFCMKLLTNRDVEPGPEFGSMC